LFSEPQGLPKTILIAIARQLLVILNAMIQKSQPWQIT
jgi:hypothetical protein